MALELKIPEIAESITEVEIGGWLKKTGEAVKKDEPLVTLESEKATVELPAPDEGKLTQVLKKDGEVAKVGEVIGYMERDGQADAPARPAETAPEKKAEKPPKAEAKKEEPRAPKTEKSAEQPKADSESAQAHGTVEQEKLQAKLEAPSPKQAPAAAESAPAAEPESKAEPELRPPPPREPQKPTTGAEPQLAQPTDRQEDVVRMSRLRRTVAERLVEAQRNAALLTTFNEIDMANVVVMRKEYGEAFQRKHNVKLGFMSFFVKACVEALKQFPAINAEVRGSDVVYHNYYDVGVAIGSGKGLVVPVLRNAERLSFAEIEKAIGDFGQRARENKLKPEELQGGTFTISNGGVYGSLLSTPIVNPPQSGVLGMHSIQERPVAVAGNVVIRPMMYVALTYDHRIVDGREAVTFLKRVKDTIENPARMLIEV